MLGLESLPASLKLGKSSYVLPLTDLFLDAENMVLNFFYGCSNCLEEILVKLCRRKSWQKI